MKLKAYLTLLFWDAAKTSLPKEYFELYFYPNLNQTDEQTFLLK